MKTFFVKISFFFDSITLVQFKTGTIVTLIETDLLNQAQTRFGANVANQQCGPSEALIAEYLNKL